MKSFTAKPVRFTAEELKIKAFFFDMRNFRDIMPEQVEDWVANENTCSFFIKNLGKMGMEKGDEDHPNRFSFPSVETSKVEFTLIFHFQPDGNSEHSGYFELFANINSMVEMMARRPLTNFVTILTENFKTNIEK